MNVRGQLLEKTFQLLFEMSYVFDFSLKIVVIVVQSELKLKDLTVVDAGVEMKLNKFSKVCNPFAQRSHHVLV